MNKFAIIMTVVLGVLTIVVTVLSLGTFKIHKDVLRLQDFSEAAGVARV